MLPVWYTLDPSGNLSHLHEDVRRPRIYLKSLRRTLYLPLFCLFPLYPSHCLYFHTTPSKGMCGYVSSRPVLPSDLRLATAGKSHTGLGVQVSILQQRAVVTFMTSRIGTRITSETAVELS